MAVQDPMLAEAIALAVRDYGADLVLIAYGGEMILAAERLGLRVAREVYADRAYNADGTLVSRSVAGAVLHDPEEVVRRAVRMVTEERVQAITGEWVDLQAQTICVHGDTPGSARLAGKIRSALLEAGARVQALRPIAAG